MKTADELIRGFPLFKGWRDEEYNLLLVKSFFRKYDKGIDLFMEGEKAHGLFLIRSGVVKIYKVGENGREQIIHLSYPGDSVAELPLFDDGPYPSSAAALEDTELLYIPCQSLMEIMDSRPELYKQIVRVLAGRMRKLVELVEDLSLRQVKQRLARLILKESNGKNTFILTFTNDEIAARLGSVRDVISRTFSALQNDDLITLSGRHITILNRARLEDNC